MNAPSASVQTASPISFFVLWRVLWRSFFIQATFNHERLQNLGFAYCMMPALRKLYQGEALRHAVTRHLLPFNSHPYLDSILLGVSIHLEEQAAAGQLTSPEIISRFKSGMSTTMAAIGDPLFWHSLKPMCAAIGITAAVAHAPWAPIIFLVLYNLVHLIVRIYGLFLGYFDGTKACERLERLHPTHLADRMQQIAAFFLGISSALVAVYARKTALALGEGLEEILIGTLAIMALLCMKRKILVTKLLFIFSVSTTVLVIILNHLFPLI